ncbi:MAG: NAD(P)-dependent oxidoreductase, partial [Planctomycetota bacterium]
LAAVQQADAVSIHLALTDGTRGLVGDEFLAAMKPGALLINTSRGDVIDGEALARAVEQRGIRVGLDVWNRQPKSSVAPFGDPLGALPAVYGTPHIGASTQQAQDAVAAEALRVVLAYRDTGEVPNCVNLSTARTVPCTLMVRHLDRVGVLASVLSELKADQINVLEMRNVLFQGEGAAACATIQVSRRPEPDLLERLTGREHVLNVSVALSPSGAGSP